jgi:hypothetical protein
MPLKKGKSKETISKNIKGEMKKYGKTGKIGTSKPKSKKKAQKQAVAIALSKARESGAKIPKKKSQIKESQKPDFLDVDKDGNKKEPMKKALKDKKKKKKSIVKESFDKYINLLVKESFGLGDDKPMGLDSLGDMNSNDHNEPDESEFPSKLKELPKGEYFKRKPDSKKIWIKGDHVRFYKKGKIVIRYSCTAADDMNQEIFLNPQTPVYTEFEY